jgi:hypothetical protein
MKRAVAAAALCLAAVGPSAAREAGAFDVYRAMGIPAKNVIGASVLSAKVIPGTEKQTVAMVTYFTGKKNDAEGVNVRLDVFEGDAANLKPVYSRDFGQENGGYVTRGEIQLFDLDNDGNQELIPTWDDVKNSLVDVRRGEVLLHEDGKFRAAWAGEVRYDSTRDARGTPAERRDRFTREVDLAGTLRTRGVTLFFKKTVAAVAGERLDPPKIVEETFPLRKAGDDEN